MKNIKPLNTALLMGLATLSFQAHARSAAAGLDACAQAMVNDMAVRQGAPMAYQLNTESFYGGGRLGRREVFHLEARDKNTGDVVALTECQVNNKAEVKQLIRHPLKNTNAGTRVTTQN
jgi:hypothetical protein